MSVKTSLDQKILIFVLAEFVFFSAWLGFSVAISPTPSSPALVLGASVDLIKPKSAVLNLPVRLKIPKIKVDAKIESVGLTAGGAVDVPKNQSNVAWFNLGPRPGENGNAIIAGHYGWKNNKPSVFDNLYKLRPGDKIYVTDEKGVTITFVVRELKRYKPTDQALEVFVAGDGKAHLNLITCEGVWNKVLKSYSKRLVIFTDQE